MITTFTRKLSSMLFNSSQEELYNPPPPTSPQWGIKGGVSIIEFTPFKPLIQVKKGSVT